VHQVCHHRFAVKISLISINFCIARYWGKRDTKLILPTNSSLSITLDQDNLKATTTSRADSSFNSDQLWLNGVEEEIKPGGRLATCLAELRKLRKLEDEKVDGPKVRYKTHLLVNI
jgi:diphosphomevalonate decarboxylase